MKKEPKSSGGEETRARPIASNGLEPLFRALLLVVMAIAVPVVIMLDDREIAWGLELLNHGFLLVVLGMLIAFVATFLCEFFHQQGGPR